MNVAETLQAANLQAENQQTDTTSAEFFEAKYRASEDPWEFAESEYELWRYGRILRALEGRRYARAFEPGCSVGVLTEKLAGVCDAVEAIDFSATAVASARGRCAGLAHVRVECMSLPERLPLVGFDLVVMSEIGYYFSAEVWRAMMHDMVDRMAPGATLLGAHWLGVSADHLMSGDEVHAILREDARLRLEAEERHERFRLDRWRKI